MFDCVSYVIDSDNYILQYSQHSPNSFKAHKSALKGKPKSLYISMPYPILTNKRGNKNEW